MNEISWGALLVAALTGLGYVIRQALIKYADAKIEEGRARAAAELEARRDEREYRQELGELEYNLKAQAEATAESRRWATEQTAMSILQEMLSWAKEDFTKMAAKLDIMHHAVNRVGDLKTIQNQILAELVDEVRAMIAKIDEFLK